MHRSLRYGLSAVAFIVVFSLIYGSWPWSGTIIALGGVGALCYRLYNAGWQRTAGWSAGVGVAIVVVFLIGYHWPKRDAREEAKSERAGIEATEPDKPALKEVVLHPGVDYRIVVRPDWRVDVWPEDPAAVEGEWTRSGVNLVLTLRASKKTAAQYRLYECSPPRLPCDDKLPKLGPVELPEEDPQYVEPRPEPELPPVLRARKIVL